MINSRDCLRRVIEVTIHTVNGGTDFELNEEEARLFLENPDSIAAELLGFHSESEYVEWMTLDGYPRCGGVTKRGKPCKVILCHQLDPEEFTKTHRAEYCHTHALK